MRKLAFLFTMVIAMLFVSCGEDEPEQSFSPTPDSPGEIDAQVLDALKQEGSVVSYNIKGSKVFDHYFGYSQSWMENTEFYAVMDNEIKFQNGKVWEPLFMERPSTVVPGTITIFQAYYTATKNPVPKVYITWAFDYDKSSRCLKIGREKFRLLELTVSSLTLGKISKIKGHEGWGDLGERMDVANYGVVESLPIVIDENVQTFNTDLEYCRHLSKIAREHFGRFIDLDKIYQNVFYDDSPIDLDEYDRRLDRFEELSKKYD